MKFGKLKKKLKNGYVAQLENCIIYADKNYIRNWWEKDHKKRIKPRTKYTYMVQGGLDYWGEVEEWYIHTNKELKEFIHNNKILEVRYED